MTGRSSLPKPVLKVVARQALSSAVQLCVVQVGSKNLVLSVSESGAQAICELTPEELLAGQPDPPALVLSTTGEGAPGEFSAPVQPTAAQVYGQIFKQYLGIFPRFGSPKR